MMLIAPPSLQINDKIAIVAPGKAIAPAQLETAIQVFESWGVEVVLGENLFKNHYQFSATDENRLSDLQWAFDNKEIKGIICARGGYGTTRIMDQLDLTAFSEQPKWVVGFSDITALIAKLNNAGFQAIHGTMPSMFDLPNATEGIDSLKKLLFEGTYSYTQPSNPLNKPGTATGQVTGGTLTLICNSLRTYSEVDTIGKILFLEDIGEYLYSIDRMMVQLKRSEKLKNLAGLIIGRFADTKDSADNPFGKIVEEIVLDAVAAYDFPVCFDFPIGHIAENMAVACGSTGVLEVAPGYTRLSSRNSLV